MMMSLDVVYRSLFMLVFIASRYRMKYTPRARGGIIFICRRLMSNFDRPELLFILRWRAWQLPRSRLARKWRHFYFHFIIAAA